MRILTSLACLAAIILAGCTDLRTYTFEKERVDQSLEGNRGYIVGTPPAASSVKETPKRTMIGVDFDIPPLLPSEGKAPKGKKTSAVKKEIKAEVKKEEVKRGEGYSVK